LTVLIRPPARLIYLSSGLHNSGRDALDDIDWTTRRWNGTQAYCDSKLYVTTLAPAIADRWPTVHSNAVDPGWVPTRMGGHSATDDLRLGQLTQVWLATSNDATAAMIGGYWHHQRTVRPAAAASDDRFQEQLVDELGRITGEPLP
jgi:NAD(P)-dependent dehydrogenase (short-subunit alcohol dehydrogenase family)